MKRAPSRCPDFIGSLACALFVIAATAGALEIHVSPSGNDAADGTRDHPFRTVGRAKAEVRSRMAAGPREAGTVLLHGGTYELPETLTFHPEDSGTDEFPVTYAAAPGETVILSGGRSIADWTRDDRGRWTAKLPAVKAGEWFFRQLVVNDHRAVRARWPDDEGVLRIATVTNGVSTFTFNLALPGGSLAGQDTEMVVYENWSITRGLVAASDERRVTTATPMGWIGHGDDTTASPGKAAFLEHAQVFLDQPGEWFLDRADGILQYLPKAGENPGQTPVVAPRLERVLALAGTKEKPVRNLRFEGLRFEHADFPLPSFGYNEIQAAHYGTTTKAPVHVRPVAVECAWAENCRFERCRFAHLNGSGVGFGPGCRNNAVVGCEIDDIGGNGVMVGWRGAGKMKAGITLDADWDDPADTPTGNEIADCRFQRCGADSAGGVAVFVAFSADTCVAHNLVHDMPYTGISLGFRWDTKPTSQARCLVEFNHVRDVMLKLADGGGIYTLGFQPGTVLRGNRIHDVRRGATAAGAPNNGFFIDQGSKGFLFESNVVHATAGAPVRFNVSRKEWHEWRDNFLGDQDAKAEGARAVAARAGPEEPNGR